MSRSEIGMETGKEVFGIVFGIIKHEKVCHLYRMYW